MAQISKILKAWIKVLKGITTEEDKRRAEICQKCPKAKEMKYFDFINDELHEVRGMICSKELGGCGCPLVAKIRSTDKCKKW